jgi:hypothetical protein
MKEKIRDLYKIQGTSKITKMRYEALWNRKNFGVILLSQKNLEAVKYDWRDLKIIYKTCEVDKKFEMYETRPDKLKKSCGSIERGLRDLEKFDNKIQDLGKSQKIQR